MQDISIENWITLYNQCINIHDLKPQISKDYIAFKSKKSNPIKLGQTDKFVTYIPRQLQYYKFFENNKLFWMIPLELPDSTIIGFILKGYSKKEYRTVTFSKYSIFFGLYDFIDFQKNKLIILTEGSKDSLYIKQIYPYTIALNTSKLTTKLINIIKYLTNRVLLVYDNDNTGYSQKAVNAVEFKNYGINTFNINYTLKDPGEYFLASSVQKQALENEIKKVIMIANR